MKLYIIEHQNYLIGKTISHALLTGESSEDLYQLITTTDGGICIHQVYISTDYDDEKEMVVANLRKSSVLYLIANNGCIIYLKLKIRLYMYQQKHQCQLWKQQGCKKILKSNSI